jgi:uncharacterized protein
MRFLADMASGAFDVEPVHPTDWLRIADLVSRYRDLPLGTVDASVVACAERLGVEDIATVDRRRFTVVKARRARTLLEPGVSIFETLVPAYASKLP